MKRSNEKPRLLFVVAEDWYFVSHRLSLTISAQAAGFDVAVATRVGGNGSAIEQAGIRTIPIRLARASRNPLRELEAILELVRIYRQERPDIVHHVALKPVLYGSIAAWLARVPGVVNAIAGLGHVFVAASNRMRLLRAAISVAFRLLFSRGNTRVIVQNPDDHALLQQGLRVSPSQLRLIRGAGVDLEVFYPRPFPDSVLVLLPARMLWEKGVAEFVAAARLIREVDSHVRFALVGEPDQANPGAVPVAQLEAWQRQGDTEWWGYRNDMPEVLAQASVICLPSYYGEGVPKSLIEAAACGRPIVTTDMPGCREIVRDGVNGLLVPARDVAALAGALQRLIHNRGLRDTMGSAGRRLVEEGFSSERVAAETIALYRELLEATEFRKGALHDET